VYGGAGGDSHTYSYSHGNWASSSSYPHAKAATDSDGAAHCTASPDTAAASSDNYAYCGATTHSASSYHTSASSAIAATYCISAPVEIFVLARILVKR